MLTAEIVMKAQFYDLDPMSVVWHGNYARYLEEARCALLERIGYSYAEMRDSGYLWPIVDMRIRYVAPLRESQEFVVTATLVEYEHRIRIDYRICDLTSGDVLTKARTDQVAVHAATGELCLESPSVLIDKVQAVL